MSDRLIEPYIRRDDISWWAGCRYVDRRPYEVPYINETSCITRWGAITKSKRMAAQARRLRSQGALGTWVTGGAA